MVAPLGRTSVRLVTGGRILARKAAVRRMKLGTPAVAAPPPL
jgi:hypothetical protein